VQRAKLRLGLCVALVAAIAGCDAGVDEPPTGRSAAATPKRSAAGTAKGTASATQMARSTKRASQSPTPGCVSGWVEPKRNTALRSLPLALLREAQHMDGLFSIVDMRYFKGPDDTNLAPDSQPTQVERWYARVVHTKDRTFRIRLIARRSSVGAGIVAIAPYDSKGFVAGDWRGLEGEGDPKIYPGLPGRWPAAPYDYVASGELPAEVVGCLAD
jgi:hypothetical protein